MIKRTVRAKTSVVLKDPKIREKKLPARVLGECIPADFDIWIDPRQDSYEYLDTLIHEITHCILPDLSETNVAKMARLYSRAIWKKGYRRIKP